MPRRTLITGATGFIGRRLVRSLIARGDQVTALVRGRGAPSARRRLLELTAVEGGNSQLQVVPGDVADAAARADLIERLVDAGPYDRVFHLAALLDLGCRRAEHLVETNVDGTDTALEVTRRSGARHFHHVGTAYSCGLSDGAVPETRLPQPTAFRNAYERSKHDAEELVWDAAGADLGISVYRPSIVVGRAADGATDVFGAFYDVVRACALAAEAGAPDEVVWLPGDPSAHVDLVPVDRVVAALVELSERPPLDVRVYHLTSPRPPTLGELAEAARAEYGIDVRIGATDDHDLPGASAMFPYLRDAPAFETRNTTRALGADFLAPVVESADWVRTLIRFAAAAGFGRDAATHEREVRILARTRSRGRSCNRASGRSPAVTAPPATIRMHPGPDAADAFVFEPLIAGRIVNDRER